MCSNKQEELEVPGFIQTTLVWTKMVFQYIPVCIKVYGKLLTFNCLAYRRCDVSTFELGNCCYTFRVSLYFFFFAQGKQVGFWDRV